MDSITIGQIGLFLTFIAGLITAFATIYRWLKKWLDKLFAAQLKDIDDRIKSVEKRVDAVDQEACKNYLVTLLSDAERGKPLDEIEKERFYEQYEHYVKNGGNSYIKSKVERLKAENKI